MRDMPIYLYYCDTCERSEEVIRSFSNAPPIGDETTCVCGGTMTRVVNIPQLPPSVVDHNDVPMKYRTTENLARNPNGLSPARARRKERAYREKLEGYRKQLREHGRNHRAWKKTHEIPTELYWNKINQTGDKTYWDDPKNRAKHPETKV